MAAYFAMRTITKYNESGLVAAQTYYNQIFAIPLYQTYQADTNAILIVDGYGDVIPVV